MIRSVGTGTRLLGLELQLHSLPAVCPEANYLTSLTSVSSSITWKLMYLPQRVAVMIKCVNTYKALRREPTHVSLYFLSAPFAIIICSVSSLPAHSFTC